MSSLEVKGTDQLIAAEDKRSLSMGHHSEEGRCNTTATGIGPLLSVLSGGVRGRGGGQAQGCMPDCVSVPGLVSRVEKEAAKPEG